MSRQDFSPKLAIGNWQAAKQITSPKNRDNWDHEYQTPGLKFQYYKK
jgi:hypothetical protein